MAKEAKTAEPMEIPMKLDKETKGTYVYVEGDVPNPRVPSIYIRKSAFAGKAPESITLVIK